MAAQLMPPTHRDAMKASGTSLKSDLPKVNIAAVDRILKYTPIDGLDEYSTEDLVRSLQAMLGNDSSNTKKAHCFWNKITTLVSQLKSTRQILATIKRRQSTLQIVIPPKIQQRDEHHTVHSKPAPPPPSPILYEKKRAQFCGGKGSTILRTMTKYKNDEKIQERGCISLVNYLQLVKRNKDVEESKKLSWTCGVCSFRNQLPKNFRNDRTTGGNGANSFNCYICAAPTEQSRLDSVAVVSGESDGSSVDDALPIEIVGPLIDAMRNFRTNIRVQRACCYSLAQLVQDEDEAIVQFASKGGIAALLVTMQTYHKEAEIQAQSLGILANPGLLDDNLVRVEAEKFATVVISTMRRFPKHQRLQSLCFIALANLAYKNEKHVILIISTGFGRVIDHVINVTTSTSNQKNPYIVASALWFLASLTRDLVDSYHFVTRKLVEERGGVQFCMKALQDFPVHSAVQQNSHLLLSYLGATVDKVLGVRSDHVDRIVKKKDVFRKNSSLPQDTMDIRDEVDNTQECSIQ